jgi:hypothetical protein
MFNLINVCQVAIIVGCIFIFIKQEKILKKQEKTLKGLNRTHYYQNINSDPHQPENEKEWQKALEIFNERAKKELEEERKRKAWFQLLSERPDIYQMVAERGNKGLTEEEFLYLLDEHNNTKGGAK